MARTEPHIKDYCSVCKKKLTRKNATFSITERIGNIIYYRTACLACKLESYGK